MYCHECGKKIKDDALFCSGCGNKIEYIPQDYDKKSEILNDIAEGKRVLCTDGCCTGIINVDGVCRTCGKAFDWTEEKKLADEKLEDEKLYEFEQKILQGEKTNELKCPRCSSTQLTSQKKGFGLGKAAVGGIFLGGVGLLGGLIGSGKIKITCLSCGHSWKAGYG